MEVDTVLVKVASRCNIDCSYCYVYNMGNDSWKEMPAVISSCTIEALSNSLQQLVTSQSRVFATVLHGGEPLMLGLSKFSKLLGSLRVVLPTSYPISMQTNGMLITSDILNVCSEYKVSISISLDGPESVNDKFRIDKRGSGTYRQVINGIEALRKHPDSEFLFSGLLAVIDPYSCPNEIYNFFKEINTPSVDFIYRDGNHDRLPYGKESLESTEYGVWLESVLSLHINDPKPMRIRFLDDILKLLLGGASSKEGLGEELYGIVIVETDGSLTKNDTLKSVGNKADKFITLKSVHEGGLSDFFNSDEFKSYYQLQRPESRDCLSCSHLNICGGGMPLHRWSNSKGFNNPSVYCADQKHIISAASKFILEHRVR